MQDKLSVRVDGEDHNLFMSYGLLSRLTGIIANSGIEQGALGTDEAVRDAVIISCLQKRGKSGFLEIEDENFTLDCIDLSVEEAEKIFDWASEHVTSFFMRRLETGTKLVKPYLEKLNSMSSIVGSNDSASKKESAGDSE